MNLIQNTIISTIVGKNPLGGKKNGVDFIVNRWVWNAVLGCDLKNDRMIFIHFQGKALNMTAIQGYATTTNAKEAEVEWFYDDL